MELGHTSNLAVYVRVIDPAARAGSRGSSSPGTSRSRRTSRRPSARGAPARRATRGEPSSRASRRRSSPRPPGCATRFSNQAGLCGRPPYEATRTIASPSSMYVSGTVRRSPGPPPHRRQQQHRHARDPLPGAPAACRVEAAVERRERLDSQRHARSRSAAWSCRAASPARPSPIGSPSRATTGITSRTDDVVNASSAAASSATANLPSSTS